MNPQEFDQLLKGSALNPKERGEAWRLFKTGDTAGAAAFVETVNTKMAALRAQQALRDQPIPYRIWGRDHIENGALTQMINAARLPVAVAGALMPDAHQGYGLPIGGVLATDNVVIPYAVGVDIACRMMLTVYPVSADALHQPDSAEYNLLRKALVENTIFGAGADGIHEGKIEHPILDSPIWKETALLRGLQKTAQYQIGTSGTGNHFVEWGELTISDVQNPLGLAPGIYLALLSHSGSRGVGYNIAEHYSQLAMSQMPDLDKAVRHLAWLPLDLDVGREYWQAMNFAGDFASANHHIIHQRVAQAAGLKAAATVENHHNFAWKETVLVDGTTREAVVHRKGATPAGEGVLGVIPGTMADVGYVVIGKGSAESLSSASHGGGRRMSRTVAKAQITPQQHADYLTSRGVTLIGGGLDEAPQAYKRIETVISAQSDLVDILATFQPRLVRMATDEPPYKRKSLPEGILDAESD